MRMTLKKTYSTRDWGLLFAGIITALVIAMTVMPSISSADLWSGKLPGKTWTTDGHVYALEGIFAKVESGPSAICVGPVSESLTFPYGWDCGQGSVEWTFAPIWAAGGVDNPNSSGDSFLSSNW
jgi:hypothetical protein